MIHHHGETAKRTIVRVVARTTDQSIECDGGECLHGGATLAVFSLRFAIDSVRTPRVHQIVQRHF
jgi:hypothetical protein